MIPNSIKSSLFSLKNGPLKPFRFKILKKILKSRSIKILDIGCGNNSYHLAKKFLEIRSYHGIDKVEYDGESGYSDIPNIIYLDIDSEANKLNKLESDFDLIIMSHIIEHTLNFEKYIAILKQKLKDGGFIYIETPHPRTLKYPSAIGFLNFYDDDTHVRCFSQQEVVSILKTNGLKIIQANTRRDFFRILFISPIIILMNIFYFLPIKRKLFSSGLWDLLGVAFFVIAQK